MSYRNLNQAEDNEDLQQALLTQVLPAISLVKSHPHPLPQRKLVAEKKINSEGTINTITKVEILSYTMP